MEGISKGRLNSDSKYKKTTKQSNRLAVLNAIFKLAKQARFKQ